MSEASPERPLLLFGRPTEATRVRLNPAVGGDRVRRPGALRQGERLSGKWETLQRTMQERSTEITGELAGTDPELVLVIEIIGDRPSFIRAVQRIEGFEYLAEIDEEDVEADDFHDSSDTSTRPFDGTLFLLASNQVALNAILDLWQQYQADENARFPHGLAEWKHVFELLIDIRRWSPTDRLRGTGAIEDFNARIAEGQEIVPAEIELWFRSDDDRRRRAETVVSALVVQAGGEILTSASISAIAYHAMLVRLPVASIRPLLSDRPDDVALIRAEEIAFLRPEAQALVAVPQPGEVEEQFVVAPAEASVDPPLVAMLDGLPLARHELLDNRVIIDDPDDWAADIAPSDLQHGTAVASLILHGDSANDGMTSKRQIYARPVLIPDTAFPGSRECIPHDRLAIDVIHQAVLRIFDGSIEATALSIKLINLSLGDASNQLALMLSPWARLLDYLAYNFRVLFVVSAGNQTASIRLEHSPVDIAGMTPEKLRLETLRAIVDDAHLRRLLSPSESVNSLTVGASHEDASPNWILGARRDLLPATGHEMEILPSPFTSLGMGYRRSIKPDMIAPGGRVLYRARPGPQSAPETVFEPNASLIPPGLSVATPTARAGRLDGVRSFHGTSGSAAIVSHYGALILEELSGMRAENGDAIDPSMWAVITKALLVHGCILPPTEQELREAFGPARSDRMRDNISRFYGYGVANVERSLRSTDQRATAVGWGELGVDEAEIYELPLPPSMSGVAGFRRLTITLAYFAPIRLRSRVHRAAELFFIPDLDTLRLQRAEADWRSVRRGTVQHEVLVGDRAAAFVSGDTLKIQVNCRSLIGTLADRVPYGLAVTLECAQPLPIYQEIAVRLQAQARTRIRTR
jgi:hypothetical protein